MARAAGRFTAARIAKATDAELEARAKAMWADAHKNNGMTRAGWNEWHAIHDEQVRRKGGVQRNPRKRESKRTLKAKWPVGAIITRDRISEELGGDSNVGLELYCPYVTKSADVRTIKCEVYDDDKNHYYSVDFDFAFDDPETCVDWMLGQVASLAGATELRFPGHPEFNAS